MARTTMSTPDTAYQKLPENPWPALWAMVIGFFMILVDSTIVSVAIPSLITHFGTDVASVMWVTSAYLVTYAVPLLITGRLGDRIGPKWVYLAGLVVFTISSLACGLSPSIAWLIGFRAVQGLGASMMTPQTMAVIARTFPADRRGSAMALWGATAGVATLVGPVLGGLLIDGWGWEWIFFVNVPVGVIAFVAAWRFVPRLTTHTHTFDLVGVALSAIGTFCAVFGLQEGETYNWGQIWGPISVPLLIGFGVVVLGLFVWWQARTRREPLVPLALFRDRNFSVSNLAVTTVGFSITAMIFPFMLYAQVVRGLSPTQAALLMAPQAVVTMILAPWVGRLVDRMHPRLLAGFGLMAFAVCLIVLSRLMTPDSSMGSLLAVAGLLGVASSFMWGPLATSANRNLPPQMAGAGSGVYNTTRQMGAVVGSAAIAAFLESRIAAHVPAVAGSASMEGRSGGGGLPAAIAGPFSEALADAMLLPAGVILLGWVAVLFFEQSRHLQPGTTTAPGADPVSGAPVPGPPVPGGPVPGAAVPEAPVPTPPH